MTPKGLALYIYFYLVQALSLYIIDVNSKVSHNNNPLKPFLNPPMDWHQGKNFCEESDLGTLAFILDDDEQNFIRDNYFKFGKSYWLGLSDPSNSGDFVWVNGEAPVYQKWLPGQPNSKGTCVSMGEGGYWISSPCSVKLPILCRKNLPEQTTTFETETSSTPKPTAASKAVKGAVTTASSNEHSQSNSATGQNWRSSVVAISSLYLVFILKNIL